MPVNAGQETLPPPSPTAALRQQARLLREQGRAVVDIGSGELFEPTPRHVVNASRDAASSADLHHYGPAEGDTDLRAAIADIETQRTAFPVKESEVVVSNGSKQAIFSALKVLLGNQDEVLVPTPCWVTFPASVRLAGGRPVLVDSDPETLLPTVDRLKSFVTPKTRAVLLNSPNNPTGRVVPKHLVEEIARWTLSEDLWLVADETYAGVSLEPSTSPLGAVPEVADRTIIVNSVSKSYAMSGWRVGWSRSPTHTAEAIAGIQSHMTSNVNRIAQAAAAAALVGPDVPRLFRERLRSTRDLVVAVLAESGLLFPEANGAFYVFPRVAVGDCDVTFAAALLETEGVMVMPGTPFQAPGHVRVSYARDPEEVHIGIKKLCQFASEWNQG